MSFTEREHILVVESVNRVLSDYPNPQDYRIQLADSFRNVSKIELIGATIPDKNNVLQEPYLILDIENVDNIKSNSSTSDSAFSILQLNSPVSSGNFINIENRCVHKMKKSFNPPLAKLERVGIKIKDLNGNLFNFGDDTIGSPPNKNLQNVFIFRITTVINQGFGSLVSYN